MGQPIHGGRVWPQSGGCQFPESTHRHGSHWCARSQRTSREESRLLVQTSRRMPRRHLAGNGESAAAGIHGCSQRRRIDAPDHADLIVGEVDRFCAEFRERVDHSYAVRLFRASRWDQWPAPASSAQQINGGSMVGDRSFLDRRIAFDGDTWRIIGVGTFLEGKTYCHMASESRGRQQKNGWCPRQTTDWIDLSAFVEVDGVLRDASSVEMAPDDEDAAGPR